MNSSIDAEIELAQIMEIFGLAWLLYFLLSLKLVKQYLLLRAWQVGIFLLKPRGIQIINLLKALLLISLWLIIIDNISQALAEHILAIVFVRGAAHQVVGCMLLLD